MGQTRALYGVVHACLRVFVPACVCVCERERERERECVCGIVCVFFF
jgi:hypothetical protein